MGINGIYRNFYSKREKKIRIKLKVKNVLGALDALDRMVEQCTMSEDEDTRMIDATFWSSDFCDILASLEKRTRWWKKKK